RGRRHRACRPVATSPGRRKPVNGVAVLAYSGGLDTSCAIAWLKEDYGFEEVVAVLVDVGQVASFHPAIERGKLAGADDVPLRDRVWTRDAEIAYAQERGIPVEAKAESPYSIDDNLFGRAIEAGILEDPWTAPPEDAFLLTADSSAAPAPADVIVSFEEGLPVSIDEEE